VDRTVATEVSWLVLVVLVSFGLPWFLKLQTPMVRYPEEVHNQTHYTACHVLASLLCVAHIDIGSSWSRSRSIAMRYVVTALASFLFASSGLAQEFQDLRDPETAEPVPVGFAAPPTDYERPDRSGGFELIPIQHVAEGSTKLVRTHPNGVLFLNGAYQSFLPSRQVKRACICLRDR